MSTDCSPGWSSVSHVSLLVSTVLHCCLQVCVCGGGGPQPLTPTPLPQLPWQKVATDLFEWKQTTYLLVVDLLPGQLRQGSRGERLRSLPLSPGG